MARSLRSTSTREELKVVKDACWSTIENNTAVSLLDVSRRYNACQAALLQQPEIIIYKNIHNQKNQRGAMAREFRELRVDYREDAVKNTIELSGNGVVLQF